MNYRHESVWLILAVVCSAWWSASSQDSGSAPTLSEQAQQALAQGRYADAEQAYEKLSKIDPGTAEVHANLGLIYFEERKFEQSVSESRRALKLRPGLSKTEALMAMSLSELGRYGEAVPGLEKCFHRSVDAEIKRMCGLQLERSYTGLQHDSKAVEAALELQRRYPDDAEVLYYSGKTLGNSAFLAMERLAKVAPASIWRHQAAAEANESQGLYDAAISEYRAVLGQDPRRPGIHYRIGRTLLVRSHQKNSPEDVATAQKEFQQELQVDPSNGNAAYEIAEFHRQAGHFEEAQNFFERALNSYPNFEEAHTGLASVLVSLKKPQDALPHLQKAIELNPDDDVAWFRLAQVQRALGNTAEQQKALTEFQRLRHQFNQQKEIESVSPHEVTKQELDPGAPQ